MQFGREWKMIVVSSHYRRTDERIGSAGNGIFSGWWWNRIYEPNVSGAFFLHYREAGQSFALGLLFGRKNQIFIAVTAVMIKNIGCDRIVERVEIHNV